MSALRYVSFLLTCCCLASVNELDANEPGALDFNRDVRPILAAKCFHCHGPDAMARQAELRLDREEDALRVRSENGVERRVLVPGRPDASELIRRITAEDADQRMPPADEPRQLNQHDIQVLRQWITEGASYDAHWAFLPPDRPALPAVSDTDWPRNGIDHFVLRRLDDAGLRPSEEADRAALIRRVTLDLTGLPPTPEQVDAFSADDSPDAYERLVDRLLASPRYGEHMARSWLDAARYADSGGYQGDILRSMWLWRDWVIDAYNAGMPFDQFTIEQLAGDLLPAATQDQRIATGFNRNHRINDEDGIILEEFRVEYVADRVETTATVWLGLTLGCARCHDHKYDPFSQREFYRFYAYFNSIAEKGRGNGNSPPLLTVLSPDQRMRSDALRQQIGDLETELDASGTTAGNGETAERDDVAAAAPAASAPQGTVDLRQEQLAALRKQHEQLLATAANTMVMEELAEPRATFVLIRGAYDQPGARVEPGVPEALSSAEVGGNRLDLAHWLVDQTNPLTARVAVNRYWQQYFGHGLVRTPEDFGTQGELPSHPDLLDWLATEFLRNGWDVKAMQRLIVTSSTYRQSSKASAERYERDPDNRLLARGPRYRMAAEVLRDQALAAAGLLSRRIGGPSVKPYQPPGLWEELVSASREYQQSRGEDLYRRSVYTFVRRTVPPPLMIAFDATNRELCTVRRGRTNTPLQSLAMMNDPTFVEAARVLAERTLRHAGGNDAQRLSHMYRLLTARHPDDVEQQVLMETLSYYRQRYAVDRDAAQQLLGVGETSPDAALDASELAAFTAMAGLMMNLDETLTKQ